MSVKSDYAPMPRFLAKFPDISGNAVNGLGEREYRPAAPFFWHPPDKQTHGALQAEVISFHRKSPEMRAVFNPKADRGPKLIAQAPDRVEKSAAEWTREIRDYALAHDGDLVGITDVKPDYIYEGYQIEEPNLILIAVAMDHDILNEAPATFEDPEAGVEVGRHYNRAARACRMLANFILSHGHRAKAWPGPYASALNMLPAAIDAGLGELGKHGSLINRVYGSCFRLSAVSTDMPLEFDSVDIFGADEFCTSCQVCANACPPDAISHEKQWVRGAEKWYVDFDKCIPYFGEALGCGICIARCPWSKPGTAPRLAEKLARRKVRSG